MLERSPVPFRLALTMARKSECYPHKVGACLARGRRIISAGYNQTKTHPMTLRFRNSCIIGLHAEMHATVGTDDGSLDGADIYVVRLRRDGRLGMAKPCKICQGFLKKLGVKRAYFTDRTGCTDSIKL